MTTVFWDAVDIDKTAYCGELTLGIVSLDEVEDAIFKEVNKIHFITSITATVVFPNGYQKSLSFKAF